MPVIAYSPIVQLQFLLNAHGYDAGPIDGIEGPKTMEAEAQYRQAFSLPHGDQPRLFEQLARDLTPGAAAVREGLRHLLYSEHPPSSNRTRFGEWFGVNGVRWCAIFVSYCFAVGARARIADEMPGPGSRPGRGCAYVPTILEWLERTGRLLFPGSVLRAGDIVIFAFHGGRPNHIGLVARATPGRELRFQSLEGNTSLGNDSNGGQVLLRPRTGHSVVAFGRL